MTAEPLRRRSIFPVRQPEPEISETQVAEVASRNGFASVSSPEPRPPAVQQATATDTTPRRKRQLTGRDHQFNVRLRRETIDFIYEVSNSRNVPIAQVIEEMANALQAKITEKSSLS